jgi:predicted DNA-binding transcriptional regulator AlpA
MQLIDAKGVAKKLALHPRRIYELVRKDSTFPQPFRLTCKALRWVESDVDSWINTKKGEANVQSD